MDRSLEPRPAFWSVSLPAALLALSFASPAPSDEPESPPDAPAARERAEEPIDAGPPDAVLDPVIVTATRLDESAFDVPYTVTPVDGAAATTERGARTLPEALREVPGVMVQKTSTGQGSPFIRGFTGFRTLFLIDDIRLNNAVWREGPNQYWNTVDLLTVDRLEVVKGPSSVLYGSDAIGGTVNALTRKRDPEHVAGRWSLSGLDFERRLYYRFASAERSHIGRAEASVAQDGRVGILAGVSAKDFGDVNAGRHTGPLERTDYSELDGDLKAIYRVAPDVDLVFALERVRQDDVHRTHSTVYSESYRGTAIGTDLTRELDQLRTLGYIQLRAKDLKPWLSRLTASVSYHLQEEVEVRTRSNLRTQKQGFEDGTTGAWVQLESPSPLGTFTYGAELYHDEVDSFSRELDPDGTLRSESPRGPVADDSTYDLAGVYVQDRIELLERFELTLGGRFNYALAEAEEVDPDPANPPLFEELEEDYESLVGSARLLYRATDAWNVFAGASQGFRAPNLSDLTRFDVARSGEVEVPAPDLDPEEFLTLEAGTKARIESWRLEAYAAYYYTFIDDMIVRFPTGNLIDGLPEVTKDNVGDGFVQGVELGLSWNFYEGFTAFGSFAYVTGEADTFVGTKVEREPISRLQPTTALLGLRWDSLSRKVWVEGTVLIVDNQDDLAPEDRLDTQRIPPGGTPGYTIYSIRGGFTPIEGLKLFTGVENITDRDYRIHGSGQNEPGTNFILGADWTF